MVWWTAWHPRTSWDAKLYRETGWFFSHPFEKYPPGDGYISHLGKRKIIFKMPFLGDMLVPWRVCFLSNWIFFPKNRDEHKNLWNHHLIKHLPAGFVPPAARNTNGQQRHHATAPGTSTVNDRKCVTMLKQNDMHYINYICILHVSSWFFQDVCTKQYYTDIFLDITYSMHVYEIQNY